MVMDGVATSPWENGCVMEIVVKQDWMKENACMNVVVVKDVQTVRYTMENVLIDFFVFIRHQAVGDFYIKKP